MNIEEEGTNIWWIIVMKKGRKNKKRNGAQTFELIQRKNKGEWGQSFYWV